MPNVLGYVRVSTEEQADSRAGLEAQRAAILAEAERRGWKLVEIIEDAGFSGKDLKRPGLLTALEELKAQRADALVVAKLDRLSRSLLDFADIMNRATREKWALIALDLNVDSSTPTGEAMANMLAVFAQLERRLIGQRTRDALAIQKARGAPIGRPVSVPEHIAARAAAMKADGLSLRSIAATLNAEGIPTGHGGRAWHASTVRSVLTRTGGK